MFTNSIDRKPTLKKPDGNIVRDLTKSIFDFEAANFITYKAYKVPAEYVMRPDLISQAVYNNTSYTELVLKYNGISNPFTINQSDVILIPGLESAKQSLKGQGRIVNNDSADRLRKSYRYIDPTKKPDRDPDTDNYDRRKLKEGDLPPNIAEEGENQISYRNGRVYFGESIGTSACLKNGMSSSEFLTKVIKTKVKR